MIALLLTSWLAATAPVMELHTDYAANSVVLLHAQNAAGAQQVGTGFLVAVQGSTYLVTAQHVVHDLGAGMSVTFGGNGGVAETHTIADMAGTPVAWVFHGTADVAVIELQGNAASAIAQLTARALQPPHLISKLEAPPRTRTLMTAGFPLGIGALVMGPDLRVSAITRESRAASGLLTFPRFDTQQITTFFVLDNATIGGFSGGPVFMLDAPILGEGGIGWGPPDGYCMGIVHGTISDNTGGKLAAITPVAFVTETLERAHRAAHGMPSP